MAKSMRAIVHQTRGPVRVEHIPCPEPGPGEVRIGVAAAGVNRPDLLQLDGLYPAPAGACDRLGLEAAGWIDAVGPGVSRWRVGDPVCALLNGGGFAEFAIAPQGSVLPWPKGLDAAAAAALPEAALTVWANVFEAGRLRMGETLLVHGGASGIGTTAVQMGRAAGARVLATAGGPERCALVERLGAERAINHRSEDFEQVVLALGGADVVLDMVGGRYVQKNLTLLRAEGRLVQIAFLEGSRVELDLMRVMLKRLTLTGSTLRARPDAEKARLAGEVERAVWPWIAAGALRVVIDRVYPLEAAAEALEQMRSGGPAGKLVLEIRPGFSPG
jgi:putative PIG3 family NAD(P)H quinone oxidoreductase